MKTANKDIAHLLRSVAAVYLLNNENRFRIIAYEKAADTVEELNREIKDIWENDQLSTVSGIGPSILQHLDEYFKKGQDSYLIKVVKKIPSSVFALMRVPGIGPKKAYKLVNHLKISDEKTVFKDILAAAKKNRIAEMKNFGQKSQDEIVIAIETFLKAGSCEERMPLPYAYRLYEAVKEHMLQNNHVAAIDCMGSLRRKVSTIGDIDVVVVCNTAHAKSVIDHFAAFPGKAKIENQGEEKASIIVGGGRRVDIRVASPQSYGAMLQYFTGSKIHNIKLREYALKKGYSLSEYGIKQMGGKKKTKDRKTEQKIRQFKTENEFYQFLGLQYIPPEIREGTNEIELALKNKIPDLINTKDVKGDLQIHTNYNLEPSHDLGQNSPFEILIKADKLGYEYVAFTDHNPSVGNHQQSEIVNIMKKRYETIKAQLSKKNVRCNFFISCEVDILPNGKIALPIKALEHVDFILVSIHSSFRMGREAMTQRILRAITYPKVKILAHPTTRLLGRREEIEADWNQVFAECKRRNIAIEINAYPERLDLPDTLVREAKNHKVKFSLGTDSHAVEQMDNMFYGVSVARRGWLEKDQVLNALSYKKVKEWLL